MKAKYLIRDLGASFLYAAGLTKPARIAKKNLTIVTFHRFLPSEFRDVYPHRGISVTPDFFGMFLEFFTSHFECRTLSDAIRTWQSGSGGSKPLLAITVDDGVEDNFVYARPLLAAAGVPATFFIAVDAVQQQRHLWHDVIGFLVQQIMGESGRAAAALAPYMKMDPLPQTLPPDTPEHLAEVAKRMTDEEREEMMSRLRELAGDPSFPKWSGMMDWDQVRTLSEEGHEIGSHTMTHAILLEECQPDLEQETCGARARLEEVLGKPVRSFAFPNGDFDEKSLQAVQNAGYESAVTTQMGINRPGSSPLTLNRINVEQERNQSILGKLSRPVFSWRLSRYQRS